jgi:hypothetical protein
VGGARTGPRGTYPSGFHDPTLRKQYKKVSKLDVSEIERSGSDIDNLSFLKKKQLYYYYLFEQHFIYCNN